MKHILKALFRRILHTVFCLFTTHHYYNNDSIRAIGYAGWVELWKFGTIAFIDSDGRLVFYW